MDQGQTNMSIDQFQKNGFCVVRQAINPDIRDIITQYALFDEMQDYTHGISGQVPLAHEKYADPAMESLLMYLLPTMEKNTGLDLYPTYSFYRVYRPGDTLHPHKDRPACEISATFCFNYSYDDSNYQWPIIIDDKKINLSPGDLAIYRGTELTHSREAFSPPNQDDWQVQTFFHYVDKNGKYNQYRFDNPRRSSIGEPLVKKNEKRYITYV